MVTTWPGCLRYAFLKEVITCFWFRLGKPYFNDVLKFNQGLPQVVKILVTMAPKMYLFFLPFFSCIAYPFSYFNFLQVSGSFRDNSIGKIKINFLISRLVIITNKEVTCIRMLRYRIKKQRQQLYDSFQLQKTNTIFGQIIKKGRLLIKMINKT